MRNRIAGISTRSQDESHDGGLNDRAAMEFFRWTPCQRRVRRMFARMQRRRIRRLLRMHAAPCATEGARDAEASPEDRAVDRGYSTRFGSGSCDCARSGSRRGVDRIHGGCRDRDLPRGGASEDRSGTGWFSAVNTDDRQPGDAEAAGAVAAIQEQSAWHRGEELVFRWPEAGYGSPTAARVVDVLPNGSIVVETLGAYTGGCELAIAPAAVLRRL